MVVKTKAGAATPFFLWDLRWAAGDLFRWVALCASWLAFFKKKKVVWWGEEWLLFSLLSA